MQGSREFVLRLEGILPTGLCLSFGFLFLGLFSYAAFFGPPVDAQQAASCADMRRFRPVILVTIGWCALYFCFLQGQAAAAFWVHKKRRHSFGNKKVDDPPASSPGVAHLAQISGTSIPFAAVKYGPRAEVQPGLIFVMDRTVGNLLEQTPPFLLGLWLHAMAASPAVAARLGWWWLMLRASYPLAFAYPSMSPRLWGLQRRLGISPCGKHPPRGLGQFALQHDPPASDQAQGGPASAGLGQLADEPWLAGHTDLVFHHSMVKVPPPWQCPSSAPAPLQGAPGDSGQRGTPRERPAH